MTYGSLVRFSIIYVPADPVYWRLLNHLPTGYANIMDFIGIQQSTHIPSSDNLSCMF